MANRRDVQMVIKARDEASQSFDKVAASADELLKTNLNLNRTAGDLSAGLKGLKSVFGDVENLNKSLAATTQEANTRLAEQAQKLLATNNALRDQRARAENLKAALAGLSAEADRAFIGPKRDGLAQQIRFVKSELSGANSSISKLSGTFDEQLSGLQASRSAYRDLTQVQQQATSQASALATQIDRQAAALSRIQAAAAVKPRVEAVTGVSRDTSSLSDMGSFYTQQNADAIREHAKAAQLLRDRLDPMAAIQRRLNAELENARHLYRAGAIDANTLALTEKRLAQETNSAKRAIERSTNPSGRPQLFGLNPYELQNLGYQVNDLVTQIASGTSISQAFAQQGGQILQIFPRVGSAITGALANPALLVGVAVIAGIGLALKEVGDQAERLRSLQSTITGLGAGAGTTARDMAAVAQAVEHYGASAADATSITQQFLRDGINPARIEQFGKAAVDLAEVTGTKVPDAAKKLADGFDGTYASLIGLQELGVRFTDDQLRTIKQLYDTGRAADAQAEAFGILTGRLREMADQQRGPSVDASRQMGRAWDDLLNSLGRLSVFKELYNSFTDFVDVLTLAISKTGDLSDRLLQLAADKQRAAVANLEADPGSAAQLAMAKDELAKLDAEIARRQRSQGTGGGPLRTAPTPQQQAKFDNEKERLDWELKIANARSDAEKTRIDSERAYSEELRNTGNVLLAQKAKQVVLDQAAAAARKKAADEAAREAKAQEKLTQFGDPLKGAGRRTSGFGFRTDPITGQRKFHSGQDIAAPMGTPVYATADGVVAFNGKKGGYGNLITVNNGKGTETNFGHLSISLVQEGQTVKKGDLIGRVGSTGRSTGPHLHYEVRQNNAPVDPNKGRFKTDIGDAIGDAIKTEDQRIQKQDQFNEKFDLEIASRQRALDLQKGMVGLSGDALLAKEREKEVSDAVAKASDDAARQGIEFDKTREEQLKRIVGLEFDLQHAREKATGPVDSGNAERQALLAQYQAALEIGDTQQADTLKGALGTVDAALKGAIESAITFWKQFDTPEARTAIAQLGTLQTQIGRSQEQVQQASLQAPLDRLKQTREELMAQIEFFQNSGQTGIAETLRTQLHGVDDALLKAIDDMLAFWQASSSPDAQNAILNLQTLRNGVVAAQQQFVITAAQIQQAFAGSLTQSVNTWTEAIMSGRNAIGATWDLFRGFSADFLQQISQMLLQQAALQLASKIGFKSPADKLTSLLNSAPLIAAGTVLSTAGAGLTAGGATLTAASGTLGVAAAAWTATAAAIAGAAGLLLAANTAGGAGIFHAGGIAGAATRSRSVWPGLFAGAARYHVGGIAGLHPGEVPAILQRGEEILTRDNPRHILNAAASGAGGGAGGNVTLKNVNLFDAGDMLTKALATTVGEKVILNHVRQNASEFRAAINS